MQLIPKQKEDRERLRKFLLFLLIVGGLFLFTEGLKWAISFLDLDIRFYLWFMPIAVSIIVVLMLRWVNQRWLKTLNNLEKLSQKQKRYLKGARKLQLLLLLTAIIILVAGYWHNLRWVEWATSSFDIRTENTSFYFWFMPIVYSVIFILIFRWWEDRTWLEIVNNLKELSQKQKRHIEQARKFSIVFLIGYILLIIVGLFLNLPLHKIDSFLNIKPFFFPKSIAFGIFGLVLWHSERTWLKIVNDLKKEIDKK